MTPLLAVVLGFAAAEPITANFGVDIVAGADGAVMNMLGTNEVVVGFVGPMLALRAHDEALWLEGAFDIAMVSGSVWGIGTTSAFVGHETPRFGVSPNIPTLTGGYRWLGENYTVGVGAGPWVQLFPGTCGDCSYLAPVLGAALEGFASFQLVPSLALEGRLILAGGNLPPEFGLRPSVAFGLSWTLGAR